MLRFLFDWIHDASDYLIQHGWNESLVNFLSGVFILAVLVASAFVVYWVVRIILKKILKTAYRRHPKAWIEVLLKRQTLSFICYFLLCLFYSKGIAYMFSELPAWIPFVTKVLKLLSLYFFLRALTGVIWTIFDIRQATIVNKTVAMKGLIQFITVIVYFIGGIVAVAILANKQPLAFIGGLSAASAVLMLVFKDSIVGLVAGVQISLNDMVRIGDWITMPSQGVDGNVTRRGRECDRHIADYGQGAEFRLDDYFDADRRADKPVGAELAGLADFGRAEDTAQYLRGFYQHQLLR